MAKNATRMMVIPSMLLLSYLSGSSFYVSVGTEDEITTNDTRITVGLASYEGKKDSSVLNALSFFLPKAAALGL